jgi:hypothetical protein
VSPAYCVAVMRRLRRGAGESWQYASSIEPPRGEAAGCSGAGQLAVCQLYRTQR